MPLHWDDRKDKGEHQKACKLLLVHPRPEDLEASPRPKGRRKPAGIQILEMLEELRHMTLQKITTLGLKSFPYPLGSTCDAWLGETGCQKMSQAFGSNVRKNNNKLITKHIRV